jgi:hypothetical protein
MDYSNIIMTSDLNAFKNVDTYTGTVVFPTSLAADATAVVDVVVPMEDAPVFSNFSAYFIEVYGALGGDLTPRWYSATTAAQSLGIDVITFGTGFVQCSIYPIISGNTITVRGIFTNPYSDPITMQPLSVPFSFVEYTLDS